MSAIKPKRVVVAMSGGVDSSVAAALLKDQGYEVIGVSLKLWDYDEEERKLSGKTCCSLDDIADAKSVCDTLGIPFYAFNHKPEFRRAVIEKFVDEYRHGRTPNPCVLCNQHIKFGVLLDEAQKMGADYLATGHYAQVFRSDDGQYHLCKGVDENKDQSYVLFHLTQQDLSRILFPVGAFSKAQIRELAKKYHLITHNKRESMEICFIPNNNHKAFIDKNYPQAKPHKGHFVDWEGKVLGEHDGIEAFTIGQRKGLNVSFGERMYVAQIQPESGTVVLARDDDLYFQGVIGQDFRFLHTPSQKIYGVKLRSQKDDIPAEIVDYQENSGRIQLRFCGPARAVTPGQALVLYDNNEVIGGGWIHQSIR